MRFFDTKGREHKIDIRPSKWARKEYGRGKFQSQVGDILDELYSAYHILEEFPCPGERLFLDFFIPRKSLAVEVQGQQHTKFNPFFHASKADFIRQQNNDDRKKEWCEINGIRLVTIDYGLEADKIKKALS